MMTVQGGSLHTPPRSNVSSNDTFATNIHLILIEAVCWIDTLIERSIVENIAF